MVRDNRSGTIVIEKIVYCSEFPRRSCGVSVAGTVVVLGETPGWSGGSGSTGKVLEEPLL